MIRETETMYNNYSNEQWNNLSQNIEPTVFFSDGSKPKKKEKVYPILLMSVSPLVLAACGGGSVSTASYDDHEDQGDISDASDSSSNQDSYDRESADDDSRGSKNTVEAISFTSTRIDYEIPGFSANEINEVATGGTDSKIFLTDRDVGNLIITPHQDSLSPDENGANRYFPLIEYTLNDDGISIHRIVDEYEFVGSKPIDTLTVKGSPALLIGGHGPEYSDGRDWPFGDLWVAKLGPTSEIEYEQVSTDNAFYHGMSAGDINGDGLDDIAAVHMGSNVIDGASFGTVHFFLQNADGNFTRELLYSENPSINGGSSILISDLDNDGQNEVLVATYGNGFSLYDIETNGEYSKRDAAYSLHIMKYDSDNGAVSNVATMPIDGSMRDIDGNGGFGVIDIAEIDIDMDGDDDLLMLLETDVDFSLELYRNDGDLDFTLITEAAFESSYFNGAESFFRHIDVLDIQGDGLPDFVLSGRNWWSNEGKVDLGKFVYINTGSGSFQSLAGTEELMLDQGLLDRNHESEVVRTINFLEADNGELHFLLTQGGDTAMNFIDVKMDVTDYIA